MCFSSWTEREGASVSIVELRRQRVNMQQAVYENVYQANADSEVK